MRAVTEAGGISQWSWGRERENLLVPGEGSQHSQGPARPPGEASGLCSQSFPSSSCLFELNQRTGRREVAPQWPMDGFLGIIENSGCCMIEAGRGRFGGSCPGASKASLAHPLFPLSGLTPRGHPCRTLVAQGRLSLLKDPA